jgi:predicted acylesterase/phospholipase RssA
MFLAEWVSGILLGSGGAISTTTAGESESNRRTEKGGADLENQAKMEKQLDKKMDENMEKAWKCISKTKYQHFVFSGGAAGGLYLYGALKTSHQQGLWDYSDVKTIWGTSAGSILAVCLALKYEWSVLDDYLVKRPWKAVFKMDMVRLMNERGLMGREFLDGLIIPLLAGKGLKADITMEELFLETGVEMHIFTTELDSLDNVFSSLDISHKTHPTWRLIDAVYASSCLPLVFVPYEIREMCLVDEDEPFEKTRMFLDGGILASFPFHYCIRDPEVDETEVLGFYLNKWEDVTVKEKLQNMKRDLFTFVKNFASSVFNFTDRTGRKPPSSDKACLISLKMDILDRFDVALIYSEEKRREYISNGSRMCLEKMIRHGYLVPDLGDLVVERVSEGVVEIIPEKVVEGVSEGVVEDIPEKVVEGATEIMQKDILIKEATEDIPEREEEKEEVEI